MEGGNACGPEAGRCVRSGRPGHAGARDHRNHAAVDGDIITIDIAVGRTLTECVVGGRTLNAVEQKGRSVLERPFALNGLTGNQRVYRLVPIRSVSPEIVPVCSRSPVNVNVESVVVQ